MRHREYICLSGLREVCHNIRPQLAASVQSVPAAKKTIEAASRIAEAASGIVDAANTVVEAANRVVEAANRVVEQSAAVAKKTEDAVRRIEEAAARIKGVACSDDEDTRKCCGAVGSGVSGNDDTDMAKIHTDIRVSNIAMPDPVQPETSTSVDEAICDILASADEETMTVIVVRNTGLLLGTTVVLAMIVVYLNIFDIASV